MAQKYEDCKSHSSFKCSLISGSNDVIKTVSQFLFLLPSQGSDLCVCCLYSLINSDFMVMRWKQQLKSQILSRFRSHGKRAIFPLLSKFYKILEIHPCLDWFTSHVHPCTNHPVARRPNLRRPAPVFYLLELMMEFPLNHMG